MTIELYFGFWWIRKQGICQPVTQLYWNIMQTASIWSTEGAEKFFRGGLEISKPVFKEGLVCLKNHPVNNSYVVSSPIHGPSNPLPRVLHSKSSQYDILKITLCPLFPGDYWEEHACMRAFFINSFLHMCTVRHGLQMFEQAVFPYLHCPVYFLIFLNMPEHMRQYKHATA